MSDCQEVGVRLHDSPVGRGCLREVVSAWRAEGCESDWWQEARGADGAVYDINIYDAGVSGHGTDDDTMLCVYGTVEVAGGLRDTDVFDVVARGTLESLET